MWYSIMNIDGGIELMIYPSIILALLFIALPIWVADGQQRRLFNQQHFQWLSGLDEFGQGSSHAEKD